MGSPLRHGCAADSCPSEILTLCVICWFLSMSYCPGRVVGSNSTRASLNSFYFILSGREIYKQSLCPY